MTEYVYTYAFQVDGMWLKPDRVWDSKDAAGDAAGYHMARSADENFYQPHKLVRVKVPT